MGFLSRYSWPRNWVLLSQVLPARRTSSELADELSERPPSERVATSYRNDEQATTATAAFDQYEQHHAIWNGSRCGQRHHVQSQRLHAATVSTNAATATTPASTTPAPASTAPASTAPASSQ